MALRRAALRRRYCPPWVTVIERMTGGAGGNAALLPDPKSGMDGAFIEGGVVAPGDRYKLEMLAALRAAGPVHAVGQGGQARKLGVPILAEELGQQHASGD